ncbi:hypothetical protein [Dactylosporangium sp. CA-139066]|uniref:hypothetical protein n=1 Tax=Dactylosporangium sp. CA-139066 TaxID=3239930 RepID=UPI003D91E97B
MAQSRSERNPRTASLPAVSRCARYAVRGLIVAGFAGAVWLLSASAAHASDGSDAIEAQVTGLLNGGGIHHQHADRLTGTVLTVLRPMTKEPVTSTVTGAVTGTVHRTVTARTTRSTTVDAPSAKHASTRRPAKAGIVKTHSKRTQEPAVQAVPVRSGSVGDVTAAATGTSVAGVDPVVAAARAADRLRALPAAEALSGAHAKPVADRTVAQGTHHVPLLPRPAPVPAPPAAGLTSGAPSTGSGLNQDAGAAAALPAAPAGAKVLTFRPEAVEDVELRLLAAEKPTVSPD